MINTLNFNVETKDETRIAQFGFSKLLCIGFAGRNREKVMEHIIELEEIGVKRPEKIPIIYPCSAILATLSNRIQVVGNETSGEVEFILLESQGETYIGLGSDHTDRSLETVSIPKSKQICAKPVGSTLWKYSQVKNHWDELILRSWITVNGQEQLYQEGKVSSILPVEDLKEVVRTEYNSMEDILVFCGTVPTHGGFVYGEKFRYELADEVINRRISHEYEIEIL